MIPRLGAGAGPLNHIAQDTMKAVERKQESRTFQGAAYKRKKHRLFAR